MRRTRVICGWALILVSFLASSFGVCVAAGPNASLGVLELAPLIKEALDRNPEVAAARAQLQAMMERIH